MFQKTRYRQLPIRTLILVSAQTIKNAIAGFKLDFSLAIVSRDEIFREYSASQDEKRRAIGCIGIDAIASR